MNFVEIICLINAILLAFLLISYIIASILTAKQLKVESKQVDKNDVLLLRVLQKYEALVQEKNVDFNALDIFDTYMYLAGVDVSEKEIDDAIQAGIELKALK